jgi:adenosylhomocysteine nucleosidase
MIGRAIRAAIFSRAALLIGAILVMTILTGVGVRSGDYSDYYLILYAFSTEGEFLARNMDMQTTETLLGRNVHIGTLHGKKVILAESGVGMTNAAMTTQRLIDQYHPRGVIFSGIAGAVDTSVNIGDIVVCKRWATHDYGYYGGRGFRPDSIEAYIPARDSIGYMMYFYADDSLYAKARRINVPDSVLQKIGTRIPRLIFGETGVSGNSFIDQVEKRLWLADNFLALTVDMESAAVAQVCMVNGTPFIIFRSASDLAGGSGSESAGEEIRQFFGVAAVNSATVVMNFIEEL